MINRGFGGSRDRDTTRFADRIIFPYEPWQIFLRAGGNDIYAGWTPEKVVADFAEFVRQGPRAAAQARKSSTSAPTRAPARWGENDKCRGLNRRIGEMALHMPRVGFVDVFDVSVDGRGPGPYRTVPGLDRLHFNDEGNKLFGDRIRPFLIETK